MTISIVNPLDIPHWDEKILRFPDCAFFHSSAWARVLSESYGYKPLYFTILDGQEISACLAIVEVSSLLTGKRGVSLPFTDYCEPLAGSAEQYQELFKEAVEFGKEHGWKSLELRGGSKFLDDAKPSSTYLAHTLNLGPPGNPKPALFRDSTRRNIKKAQEAGVKVDTSTSEQSVREFYRLNQITRREHGLPPQPYHFFEKVYEHVISKGHGFVALATRSSTVVAANIYFHFGKGAVYKYGASDKKYQHLRANNLVMWEAIQRLSDQGFSSLHLGRTDLDHAGLRQFKNGWGGMESKLSYYRYGLRASAFESNGIRKSTAIANKVFSHTPLPVLRAVGSVLYKHVG